MKIQQMLQENTKLLKNEKTFQKNPLFFGFFFEGNLLLEFSDLLKLNPESQIINLFSSKKLISLKKSNFSSK